MHTPIQGQEKRLPWCVYSEMHKIKKGGNTKERTEGIYEVMPCSTFRGKKQLINPYNFDVSSCFKLE